MIFTAIFSLIFGIALYFFGIYCSDRVENPKVRLLIALFLMLISLPFLTFIFTFDFLLAIEFRAIPHIELFNLIWGFTFGFFRLKPKAFSNKAIWYIFNCVYFLLVISFLVKPFLVKIVVPFDETKYRDRWSNFVSLQSTNYSCSASAIATILKYYKIDKTEAEVAKSIFTNEQGSKLWDMIRFLRANNFKVENLYFKDINEVPTPSIVTMSYGTIPHSVVYFGKKNGIYHFGDPIRGELKLTQKKYEKFYTKFLGHALHVKNN